MAPNLKPYLQHHSCFGNLVTFINVTLFAPMAFYYFWTKAIEGDYLLFENKKDYRSTIFGYEIIEKFEKV